MLPLILLQPCCPQTSSHRAVTVSSPILWDHQRCSTKDADSSFASESTTSAKIVDQTPSAESVVASIILASAPRLYMEPRMLCLLPSHAKRIKQPHNKATLNGRILIHKQMSSCLQQRTCMLVLAQECYFRQQELRSSILCQSDSKWQQPTIVHHKQGEGCPPFAYSLSTEDVHQDFWIESRGRALM